MITVMIIEDDPMVLEINTKYLERVKDFQLMATASDLATAKKSIGTYCPDLILLDIFLPDGKGIDFLKWLRAEDINTDVILITADNTAETISVALRYGIVDYLIKPFKFQRFEEALISYKNKVSKLGESKNLNQVIVDQLTNFEPIQQNENISNLLHLNNEINNPTFNKVLKYIQLNAKKQFTSQSIGKDLGISRITARRYLDYLEEKEVLIMEPEYGTVGRPKNIYKLNAKEKI